jgi:hypothetical protein
MKVRLNVREKGKLIDAAEFDSKQKMTSWRKKNYPNVKDTDVEIYIDDEIQETLKIKSFKEYFTEAKKGWEETVGIRLSNDSEKEFFRTKFRDADEALTWIEEKSKWKLLGQGKFASVYTSDARTAIKVTSSRDSCAKLFLEYCIKHPTNKLLPNVHWIKSFGYDLFVVKFERLLPFEKKKNRQHITWTADSIFFLMNEDLIVEWDGIDELIDLKVIPKSMTADGQFDVKKIHSDIRAANEKNRIKNPYNKEFDKILSLSGRCYNDLHEGNLMIRPKDGRLVFTDPIFNPEEL